MNRRERLMATLRGDAVDRPPVSFYELNGLDEDPTDDDPFNIYNHPSWLPLLELTRDHTDRIVMRNVALLAATVDPIEAHSQYTVKRSGQTRFVTRRLRAGDRWLASRTRQDAEVNTTWTIEPLLKDADDLRALLTCPPPVFHGNVTPGPIIKAETALGDTGIVMIDTPDPLCEAASLFDMATYTVIALTEPVLFRRLLDRFGEAILPRTEAVAAALPGRLWRIYGPEYATAPFVPPRLFAEYVSPYLGPMIGAIQRHGGYARVHCHGRLRGVLDHIAALAPDGLDPIEPPPQGDITLAEMRTRYGKDMVLFGNLEVSDIETMPTREFAGVVRCTLEQGTGGAGRGFVLMPTACPYGRVLPERTLRNYEAIIETVENW